MLKYSLYKLCGHILFSGVLVTYIALFLGRKSVLMINFSIFVFSSHAIKATPAVRSTSSTVGGMGKVGTMFSRWYFICLSQCSSASSLRQKTIQLYSKKTSGQCLRSEIFIMSLSSDANTLAI